jgi:hypothetical protein
VLMTRYLLLFGRYGLFLWGALSDERTGLSFVYAAESSQLILSRFRVPWDSRPYFTVSDLRLPISSPLATRRVTVEVFDPASTRVIEPWHGPYRNQSLSRIVAKECLLNDYPATVVALTHRNPVTVALTAANHELKLHLLRAVERLKVVYRSLPSNAVTIHVTLLPP